jgi:hypothetical protein
MAYNPYHSLSPAQDTATFRTNAFSYNLIPSNTIENIKINPETNVVTILKEDSSIEKYNVADTATSSALILEFHDAVNIALDTKSTVDAFIQSKIDDGTLTAV